MIFRRPNMRSLFDIASNPSFFSVVFSLTCAQIVEAENIHPLGPGRGENLLEPVQTHADAVGIFGDIMREEHHRLSACGGTAQSRAKIVDVGPVGAADPHRAHERVRTDILTVEIHRIEFRERDDFRFFQSFGIVRPRPSHSGAKPHYAALDEPGVACRVPTVVRIGHGPRKIPTEANACICGAISFSQYASKPSRLTVSGALR